MKILLPVAVLACMLALACSQPDPNSKEAVARDLLKLMIEQGDKNDGGLAERAQYDGDYDSPAVDNDKAYAQFFGHILRSFFGK